MAENINVEIINEVSKESQDAAQKVKTSYEEVEKSSDKAKKAIEALSKCGTVAAGGIATIAKAMGNATVAGIKCSDEFETLESQMSTMNDSVNQILGEAVSSVSSELTDNLMPTVNDGLSAMLTELRTNGLASMAELGGGLVGNLITSIAVKAPEIIQTAITIIQSFLTGIQGNLGPILSAVLNVILVIITGLLGMIPQLIIVGYQLIISLVQGINEQLPTLLPQIANILVFIVDALTNPDSILMLINTAVNLITALAQGVFDAIPLLMNVFPILIQNVVTIITKLLPNLIPVAFNLMITLAKALVSFIPDLIAYIPLIISSIIDTFANTDWGDIGRNIIRGLIDGLKSMLSELGNTIGNVARGIADGFANLLGIHSPSVVFKQFGIYCDEGYAIGIEQGSRTIQKSMNDLSVPEMFSAQTVSSRNIRAAGQNCGYAISEVQSGLGDYIVSTSASQMQTIANALERGISNIKMTADGREVGRFVSNLGFAKARA